MTELNKYSKTLTQDPTQPAAQAMLYGIGLTEEDLNKAQVGIVSTGFEGNTCNMHLNDFAKEIKKGVLDADLIGLVFHTIGVSDGMSNGTMGMRYSLVSRDVIADSIEVVVNAQYYDAVIPVVGCDKNMPGAMIALGRLNRPAILVYGGTIGAGQHCGRKLNIISAFEALGEKTLGLIDNKEYKAIIQKSVPGAGACGGMYTANTMAAAIEALGMSLPYSSSYPALSPEKAEELKTVGAAMRNLMEMDIKPLDIMTRKAFENALRIVIILGGSTNAVMHLVAMAKAVNVNLSIDDFQRMSDETSLLADMKPSGKYLMEDLHAVGGVPAVMKYLLEKNLLHGDCLTVTGKTIAENLAKLPGLKEGQDVIRPLEDPIKETGHIRILYGNIATQGSVAKITGKEGEVFSGPAVVFDNEFEAIDGILAGKVKKGNVIVIRYEGPKGGPGMPEMLKPTSAVMGVGLGKDVAMITDGRFSGGSHGFVVGHITPEAQEGGTIAIIEDGDVITIDAVSNHMNVELSDEEIARRKSLWKPKKGPTRGVLAKYARLVSNASCGCVTDEWED